MEKGSEMDDKGDGEGLGGKWVSLGERGRGVEGRGEGWRKMVEGLGEWVGGRRERQLAVREGRVGNWERESEER